MFDDHTSGYAHFPMDEGAHSVPNHDPDARELDFQGLAPAGYYVAVRMSFGHPKGSRTELPAAWVDEYTRDGLVLVDPAMKWIYANRGSVRLSELGSVDPAGVVSRAATYGLRYGAVISFSNPCERTYVSCGQFYRSDREFSGSELDVLLSRVSGLHRRTGSAVATSHAGHQVHRRVTIAAEFGCLQLGSGGRGTGA